MTTAINPMPDLPFLKGDAAKLAMWLLMLAAGAGAWVMVIMGREIWKDFSDFKHDTFEEFSVLKEKQVSIEMDAIKRGEHQFTREEHIKFSSEVNGSLNAQDKRLTRIEDSDKRITDDLSAIKSSLTTIKGGLGIPTNGKE